MADHTPYQKNIIKAYYDRRDQIMLGKLGDLVTELALADDQRTCDRLWKRAEKAMKALKVSPRVAERILKQQDPEVLARNLRNWMGKAPS